jgi:hypothetical protein
MHRGDCWPCESPAHRFTHARAAKLILIIVASRWAGMCLTSALHHTLKTCCCSVSVPERAGDNTEKHQGHSCASAGRKV